MIVTPPGTLFRYRVDYVRDDSATRVYHRVVSARDAEEAREKARAIDPLFYATIRSPRRGAEVR